MITYLDHVGIVAHTLEESLEVLVDQLGLERDTDRTPYPKGGYFAPERTKIFFVKVNLGETRIESCCPRTTRAGSASISNVVVRDCTISATARPTWSAIPSCSWNED